MAHVPPEESPTFGNALTSATEELARTLAPSLEEIWMFRYEYQPVWTVFVVTRVHLNGELQVGVVQNGWCKYR